MQPFSARARLRGLFQGPHSQCEAVRVHQQVHRVDMLLKVVLSLVLGVGVALAAKSASAREHEEAERLLQSIQESLRQAMPDAIISSSLTAADLLNLDPPPGFDIQRPSKRAKRAAEPEDDAEVTEEVGEAEGGDGEAEGQEGDADGQPPATGLRRWVIRIRNVMFGRRDLEGTEEGEAEGEPESGRTWVESLAHWFAHGIRRILVRMSGGEPADAGDAAEGVQQDQPDSTTTGRADGDSTKPQKAQPSTPATTQASTGKASAPRVPTTTASSAPEASPPAPPPPSSEASTPAATVYDDEAYDDGKKAPKPFDETNELS